MKQTLLLIAGYGTTDKTTWDKTFGALERHLAEAFPAYTVRYAFTSKAICDRLERRGEPAAYLPSVLAKAAAEGFSNVLLQPTHIIQGEADREFRERASRFAGQFGRFSIGPPLLSDTGDLQAVAKILSDAVPMREGKAVVLIGHGAGGSVNFIYAAMQTVFQVMGRPDILVGTLEAWPGVEEIAQQLRRQGYRQAALAPLMFAAGRHFNHEIAGDRENSWKVSLRERGIAVEINATSLGEHGAIRNIYEAHIRRGGSSIG